MSSLEATAKAMLQRLWDNDWKFPRDALPEWWEFWHESDQGRAWFQQLPHIADELSFLCWSIAAMESDRELGWQIAETYYLSVARSDQSRVAYSSSFTAYYVQFLLAEGDYESARTALSEILICPPRLLASTRRILQVVFVDFLLRKDRAWLVPSAIQECINLVARMYRRKRAVRPKTAWDAVECLLRMQYLRFEPFEIAPNPASDWVFGRSADPGDPASPDGT